jgi:hypothetical protein
MRFAKKFAALAAVVTVVAFAGQASAFIAPVKITAFLPAANVVTITKIKSTLPGVDQYMCSTGNVMSVATGTPVAKVQTMACVNLAFTKFKAATLTPVQQTNPQQMQTATIWFVTHISKPYYGM